MTIPIMIAGLGYSVPKTIITNEDLAKILDTSDEWISSRTGIKERRVCSGEENAITLGSEAAKNALEKAKMSGEDIQLIIAASSIPAMAYPSNACLIQDEIGAKNAAAFDITAACAGMVFAMNIAKSFIESGTYENVLIVATDTNSKFVDWEDRATCVLFGDGAGAMIMKKSPDGMNDIFSIDVFSDPIGKEYIELPISGKNCPLVEPNEQKPMLVSMIGKDVYKFVVTRLPDYIVECVEKSGLTPEEIDYLVPHQANLRIIDAMAQRLNYGSEKVVVNIEKYGNTSAASIPIAITEAIEEGKVKLPCKAIFTGFGAGMTVGTAIVNLREGIA